MRIPRRKRIPPKKAGLIDPRGKDYEFAKHTGLKLPHFKNELWAAAPSFTMAARPNPDHASYVLGTPGTKK